MSKGFRIPVYVATIEGMRGELMQTVSFNFASMFPRFYDALTRIYLHFQDLFLVSVGLERERMWVVVASDVQVDLY